MHAWKTCKLSMRMCMPLDRQRAEECLLWRYFWHVPHRTPKPLPQCFSARDSCFCWSRWRQGCKQLQTATNHDSCREGSSSTWVQARRQSYSKCIVFRNDRGVFERTRHPRLCSWPRVLWSFSKSWRRSILQSSSKAGNCSPNASFWRPIHLRVDSAYPRSVSPWWSWEGSLKIVRCLCEPVCRWISFLEVWCECSKDGHHY